MYVLHKLFYLQFVSFLSGEGDTGSDGSGVTTAALDALTSVSQMVLPSAP